MGLNLASSGYSMQIIDLPEKEPSASRKAAGLMNPVTGKRMALTWEFQRIWPIAKAFYRHAFEQLMEKDGSFLEKRIIRKSLRSTEEMNFLEAKSAWGGFGEIIRILPAIEQSSIFSETIAWAETNESYKLNVPWFLNEAAAYFRRKQMLKCIEFKPELLKKEGEGWVYDNHYYHKIISCLGLSCPWIASQLWPVKGQLYELRGLPDWGRDIVKTGIFFVPDENGLVLAGSTYEREFQNTGPDEQGYQEIVSDLHPELQKQVKIVHSWAGLRPTTPDRRPLIREIDENLYAINGLGAKGVSLAPFAASEFIRLFLEKRVSEH
jgi:glycine/D-amino acid oxidase-like deaminating enzyme